MKRITHITGDDGLTKCGVKIRYKTLLDIDGNPSCPDCRKIIREEKKRERTCEIKPRYKRRETIIKWIEDSPFRRRRKWKVYYHAECKRWHAEQIEEIDPDKCSGIKIKYETKKEAQAVADHHNATGDSWVGTYWCKDCKAWHVGHINFKERERILRRIINEYNQMIADDEQE